MQSQGARVSGPGELVAGRYELTQRIAQGGMGEVFAALDTQNGRHVALKRLLPEHADLGSLFRAEYHSIARLRHPHIIEVLEFGVDAGRPFYTMELLDGEDLLETPTVGYRQACLYLRDVATSLALLHAQRLIHRDVSPRNVRRTGSGRCKLLDFGMMVPFGVPPNVAGTPPFVSPEALDGAALDQRSDIYSLGVLAYWLITRRLPPAPEERTRREPTPKPLVRMRRAAADVPIALDDLVISMLELDPVQRPSSANEVILRLNAVAELEPDDSTELAQSFISSSRLVGRQEELAILARRLDRLADGVGGAVRISGPSGIGKTRLMQEASLLAQTRGVRVVHASSPQSTGTVHLAAELAAGLRTAAPAAFHRLEPAAREALATISNATTSGRHAAQTARHAALASARHPAHTSETRARLHDALSKLVREAARDATWLFLVDEFDYADEFSAAFVASLALEAKNIPVLVVSASAAGFGTPMSVAEMLFDRAATTLNLVDLDAESTRRLVTSLFGRMEKIERLFGWLFRSAHGNPGLTIELASLLLRRGSIRYVEGSFVLPEAEIALPVPPDMARALALRLDEVGSAGRTLAELLALHRGAIALELCLLASDTTGEQTLTALNELVKHGVLVAAGRDYGFAREALREAIASTMSASRRETVHRRLATALLAVQELHPELRLEAGWHLLHTKDDVRGANIVLEVAQGLIESGVGMRSAIDACEKSLEVLERNRAPLETRLAVRTLLCRAGYLYDYRLLTRYGDTTVELIDRWSSLDLARKLSRWIGGLAAIGVVFVLTFFKRIFATGANRGPLPYLGFLYAFRTIASYIGVRALSLDGPGAAALHARLAPFASFPRWSAAPVVYASARVWSLHPFGREAELRASVEAALVALDANRARDMTEWERQDVRVGLMLSRGVVEAYRAGSRALTLADELEAIGTRLAVAGALRVRFIYFVLRGAREEADRVRERLDIHATQGGTTWQVEWFAVPIDGLSASRYGDLVTTRECLERLEELSKELPSLLPVRDLVAMVYHHAAGEKDEAVELGARFVAHHPPQTLIGWGTGYATYAAALNAVGDYEKARDLCRAALEQVNAAEREYVFLYGMLERELSVALLMLGDEQGFLQMHESSVLRLSERHEYAALAQVNETAARAWRLRGDLQRMNESLRAMRSAATLSGSAFVASFAARMTEAHLRAALRSDPPGSPDSGESIAPPHQSDLVTPVRGLARSRTLASLRHILDESGASTALLYSIEGNDARLAGALGEAESPAELSAHSVALASAEHAGAPTISDPIAAEVAGHRYQLRVLRRANQPTLVLALRWSGDQAQVPDTLIRRLTDA